MEIYFISFMIYYYKPTILWKPNINMHPIAQTTTFSSLSPSSSSNIIKTTASILLSPLKPPHFRVAALFPSPALGNTPRWISKRHTYIPPPPPLLLVYRAETTTTNYECRVTKHCNKNQELKGNTSLARYKYLTTTVTGSIAFFSSPINISCSDFSLWNLIITFSFL